MTTYAITATIVTQRTDDYGNVWEGVRSVPTFYLDSRVQGIVSADHAADIAADVINPLAAFAREDMTVSAVAIDNGRESAELDYAQRLREATELGRQMGANAAGWVIDGSTDRATCERIVQGIEDCDPEIMDAYRVPDLSGEYADDYYLTDLATDLGTSADDSDMDDYASAWCEAAGEAFWHEVERIARYQLA